MRPTPPSDPTLVPSGDAAAIKDYAQSTVTELLGMYGLSDEAQDVTQSIPLQNFSTGHILQHHPESHSIHQRRRQLHTKSRHNQHVSMPVKIVAPKATIESMHRSPSLHTTMNTARHDPVTLLQSSSSSSTQAASEGMYAKIVDSVAKMAKMPQGMNLFNFLKSY